MFQNHSVQRTQSRQALQARLNNPLVSEDFRGQIVDMNDYCNLSAVFSAQRNAEHQIAQLSQDPNKNFPYKDPARQRQLVGLLFEAMRNQRDILDGTVKKDANKQIILDVNGEPVKRDSAVIRRMREETNIRLELLAWNLLLAIRDAQLGNLYALAWGWGRNFEHQFYDSFIDRFNAVLESVRFSKKAATDLMEPSWGCRLANAPEHEVQRKKGNATGNTKRQTLLEEAAAQRKRVHEEQEDQEEDEDNSLAPRSTWRTPSRKPRKQQKRAAPATPRRADASNQSAPSHTSEQSTLPTTPQGFSQQDRVVPQMATNNFRAQLAPEVDNSAQQFGPTNGWNAPFGMTACSATQQAAGSASYQSPAQSSVLQQHFAQNNPGEGFSFTLPVVGNHMPAAHDNTNNQILPQAKAFAIPFTQESASSPGIGPSLVTTPGGFSTCPTTPSYQTDTPFLSAPQTPWSAHTSHFACPCPVQKELGNQEWDGGLAALDAYTYNGSPQADLFSGENWMA